MEDIEKDEEADLKLKMIEGHVSRLSEHFDSVQIFATKYINGESFYWSTGRGDWSARYGNVKFWIIREENNIKDGR